MSEKLSGAIEELQQQLQEDLARVVETKKMINALCRRAGRPLLFEEDAEEHVGLGHIKADQFYGRPLATAAREYLEMRGSACKAEDILEGMERGGFDFKSVGWKDEKGRLRNLSINLAKNTSIFHRLPNGTFGLLNWYPEVKNRKAESRSGRAEDEAEGEAEEPAVEEKTNQT